MTLAIVFAIGALVGIVFIVAACVQSGNEEADWIRWMEAQAAMLGTSAKSDYPALDAENGSDDAD